MIIERTGQQVIITLDRKEAMAMALILEGAGELADWADVDQGMMNRIADACRLAQE